MDLAIVHFHLDQGGVTQVIINHLRSLAASSGDRPERISILHGGRRGAFPDSLAAAMPELAIELHALPTLEYDDEQAGANPNLLAEQLIEALSSRGFDPAETILHVHNHNLGKNLSLPGALSVLGRRGYRLMLQIHDFAEDFRPDNYRQMVCGLANGRSEALAGVLYPQASHIHYATLNARDAGVLQATGVPPERLHELPNPVTGLGALPPRDMARAKLQSALGIGPRQGYLLYPVRGIRRKNIGEALLWSVLAGPDYTIGLTLPPTSPGELPSYASWRQCVQNLDLPFAFGVGSLPDLTFAENLAAADCVLTTSVAEGFGMVFLEPWLNRLPLAGRDLPEVTADYRAEGVDLNALYTQLHVPLEEIDRDLLVGQWREIYLQTLDAFGRQPPDPSRLNEQIDARLATGLVDFAAMGHNLQLRLIERVSREPRLRARLRQLNPKIVDALAAIPTGPASPLDQAVPLDQAALICRNAEVVRGVYSLNASGERLCRAYAALAGSPRTGSLDAPPQGRRILDAFVNLDRLYPVRTEL